VILVGGMSVAPTAVGIIAHAARSGGAAVAAASDGGKDASRIVRKWRTAC